MHIWKKKMAKMTKNIYLIKNKVNNSFIMNIYYKFEQYLDEIKSKENFPDSYKNTLPIELKLLGVWVKFRKKNELICKQCQDNRLEIKKKCNYLSITFFEKYIPVELYRQMIERWMDEWADG